MKKLNIGVVGYGLMGRTHTNAYRQAPRFFDLEYEPVLKAICGRDDARGKAFAENWGYESNETDWRKLIERDDIDAIDITLGSLRDNVGAGTDGTSDTVVDTTLIDLSGVTGDTALINIDLTGEDEEAANLQDDMIIRLGDFSDGSIITTNVQDHGFSYGMGESISDGDGVRQIYVFEGSDIGDITIEGFVAGRAFARDIDVGGDLVLGDDNGFANLTTDRIDLSAFGLTEEDVVVSYNSDDQSVTITAADGQFDGSIIVTGVGVDDGTGTKDDYEDRVLDSIIF